ncbi:MAG: HEAT repeat domain-containing protein [Planctomycetaceae bacterium]|nr:HEAT repeat domain-containing protein [Planctomycetaceae bacterium]
MSGDLSQWMADLSAESAEVRATAAEQLSKLGEDARAAAVPLCRAAGDSEESVREWSVAALEELGPPSAEDLPALIELLSAESSDTVWWSVTLIGRLEQDGAAAARVLGDVLGSAATAQVRQKAAWALGQIGPAAAVAIPALEQAAAATDDPRLSRNASRALQAVRGE